MALWASTDANTSVPKFAPSLVKLTNTQNNSNLVYGNTQISAFITNEVDGVFGFDTTEQQNTRSNSTSVLTSGSPAHAGWVLRKVGTGPVLSISTGSGNKSNVGNAYITFVGGGTGNTSANAQIFVNSISNVVTTVVINNGGSYSSTPTATVSGNANVTLTLTMGGRAGRVMDETLVAMGSMTADGDGTTIW
jgi:hypothetical protein